MNCTLQKTFLQIVGMLCLYNAAFAQFAPAADIAGTTAVGRDSSAFVDWASGCTIQRGPMNIANPGLGLATAGDSTSAIGPADDVIVSLGDGGTATLTFNHPIYNGSGFDFAVFENGFMGSDSSLAFLELAFVEVSTDGQRFVRFPATTDVQNTSQLGNGAYIDCAQLNNFAGKYVANYGTPFDLQELVDSPGIDITNINYIKLIDVVGSIDSLYGSRDHNGRMVNDPWPTPFFSCGFDLDAVGVINSKGALAINIVDEAIVHLYPNPVQQGKPFNLALPEAGYTLKVFDLSGQLIHQCSTTGGLQNITVKNINSGIYFVTGESANSRFNTKLVVE